VLIKGFSVFLIISALYFTWLYTTYQPVLDQWNTEYGWMTPQQFWDIGDING
jgi:hypothetical protein